MRSFSNIMPNFADKLHLLVDSITSCVFTKNRGKTTNIFAEFRKIPYFCSLIGLYII